MEYFFFDYVKVKTEINFLNYENFVTNNNFYKHYLYDLSLMQYDKDIPEEYRKKAKNYINIHKYLIFAPYPFVGIYVLLKKRNNFFKTNLYYLERQFFFKLFAFVFICRIGQKALLKYHGDQILPLIKEKYKQTI